jgi:hypothetical protein
LAGGGVERGAKKDQRFCQRADTEKGAAELVETPARSPVKENLQVGRKTVLAGDRMLSGELVLACETVTKLAESPMKKSGEGGGLTSLPPPSPEETRAKA